MVKKIKICDRCGVNFDKEGCRTVDISYSNSLEPLDLCDDCYKEFKIWMGGGCKNDNLYCREN